jgi:hypothetical protein
MNTIPGTAFLSYQFLSSLSNTIYIIVVVMAIASVTLIICRKKYELLLPITLLAYSIAGQLPFFGSPRFRRIAQFVIIMYAAYFLWAVVDKVKSWSNLDRKKELETTYSR